MSLTMINLLWQLTTNAYMIHQIFTENTESYNLRLSGYKLVCYRYIVFHFILRGGGNRCHVLLFKSSRSVPHVHDAPPLNTSRNAIYYHGCHESQERTSSWSSRTQLIFLQIYGVGRYDV
jgi:hypothetical protein